MNDPLGKYNDWPNYPTWAVFLWLSSDEATYTRAQALAGDLPALQALVESKLGVGLARDLSAWALQVVNWAAVQTALTE